ncbi:MAG: NRDE family protein [Bacteroidota bacterium]
MCTVTYIPQPNNNFILTSNRDEAAYRSPHGLTTTELHGLEMVFPKDTGAGGTWIVAADDGRVVCLLNGAFEKHKHQPPYRRSRGIMVLDYFRYRSTNDFVKNYDFEGMEPFTFVMVGKNDLYELRWDEKQVHLRELNTSGKYMWSSATLYKTEIQLKRESWFKNWLENRKDFSLKAIQNFHLHGGEPDPWNGFVMNRMNLVQTVSITNVTKKNDRMEMVYNDLLRENILSTFIFLKREVISP